MTKPREPDPSRRVGTRVSASCVCEHVSAGGGQAVIHSERRSVCDALKAFRPPPVVCRNLGDNIPFFFFLFPGFLQNLKDQCTEIRTIVGRGLKSLSLRSVSARVSVTSGAHHHVAMVTQRQRRTASLKNHRRSLLEDR